MALYLVQHGKSLPKDMDPERALSQEGISEVEHIANAAKEHCISVACIKHSGKKRARQTAEIFASALKPKIGVQEMKGLDPLDDVSVIAGSINAGDDLMLVGHLPFMEKMTSFLITGTVDIPVFKFQNGGVVCLDIDADHNCWIIKWALMPNIGKRKSR